MKLSLLALLLVSCGSPSEPTASTGEPMNWDGGAFACNGDGPGFSWSLSLAPWHGYASTVSTVPGEVWANGAYDGATVGTISYQTDRTELFTFAWDGALTISATGPHPVAAFTVACP